MTMPNDFFLKVTSDINEVIRNNRLTTLAISKMCSFLSLVVIFAVGSLSKKLYRLKLQNSTVQQNCKRADYFTPEPGPNPKTNLKPKSCPKKTKVKLYLKNLAMFPSYFDYIFVHLRQKARLRPELSPKFLSTLGPNPTRKARPNLYLGYALCFFMNYCNDKTICCIYANIKDYGNTNQVKKTDEANWTISCSLTLYLQ